MNGQPVTHAIAREPQPSTSATTDSAARTGLRGKGFILPGMFLIAILLMQWPMLKGLLYRASGVDAPTSIIDWREGFDTALDEVKTGGKPLLLVFSASWCPPCIVMKHDVWPDAEVSDAVNRGYVPLHVDVDNPANSALAARYGIRGIPAVLIVDAQGKVLRQASFMSRAKTLAFLNAEAT